MLNKDYLDTIKQAITRIHEIHRDTNTSHRLLWEVIKAEIRGETIKYAAKKKKNISKQIEALQKEIKSLEDRLNHPDRISSDDLVQQIREKRKELEIIIEEKTRGAIIRSRARWYEQGEKPTRYFFNLEKRNYNRKVINKLITQGNKTVTDPKEILLEQKFFTKICTLQTFPSMQITTI